MGTRTSTATVKGSIASVVYNLLSDGIVKPVVSIGGSHSSNLTTGTGVNEADRAWSEYARTLVTSTNEDLDLYDLGTRDIGAGAGNDALGQTWIAAEIVGLLVTNVGPGTLTLTASGSNGWTPLLGATGTHGIAAGGVFQIYNPTDPAFAVTDASNHKLNFAASGGNCVYDVHIIARSA